MRNLTVFDGHCDTAALLWEFGGSLHSNGGHIALDRDTGLSGWAQFFAFCLPDRSQRRPMPPPEQFRLALAHFRQQLAENQDRAALCTSTAQAKAAIERGKLAAFLSLEGAEPLDCDPGRLDEAYQLGIRMIAPTWNLENALSGTCVTGGGLTDQGREFVRRAQRLGILIDVSHISQRAFWDICDIAEKPILASHSNARALCGHARNLTDDQFRAICQLGGTAGINLYNPFLVEEGGASMEDVYRHIDHFLQLGGDGHLALGADFDGCDELPTGVGGIQDMKKLADYLLGQGLAEGALYNLYSSSLWKVVEQL